MVSSFLSEWALANSWSHFSIGDKIKVVIMVGLTEDAVVHGIGNVTRDEKVIIARASSGKLYTLTKPDQAYVKKSKIDHADGLINDLNEEKAMEVKIENGNPEVATEKVAAKKKVATTEKKVVAEKKPAPSVDNNDDGLLSMAGLSRESGVSVLTLRKYAEKYGDRIPSVLGENGVRRYPLEAIEAVKAIKLENLEKWGPKASSVDEG